MSPFKLAKLSLSRHLFVTIITVVSIALSIACGGILLRLNNLSESRFSSMGKGTDAIVGAKAGGIEILLGSLNGEGKFPDFLPYKLYQSLESEQTIKHGDGVSTTPYYIERIIPFVYFGKYNDYRLVGTNANFYNRRYESESLKLQSGSWFSSSGDVVVGSLVADKYNLKVGDTIDAAPWIGDQQISGKFSLKVSGVAQPTGTQWDRTLFSSVEQAQSILENHPEATSQISIWGSQVLNYFLIDLRPNGFSGLENLINKRTVGQVIKVSDQKERLQELSGTGKSIGIFVTTFVIILGGIICQFDVSNAF